MPTIRKQNQTRGLWLRGETYWLDFTPRDDTRKRISLETADLAEAIQKAREIRAFPKRYFSKEAGDLVELFLAHQERRGISRARIELSRIVLGQLAKFASLKDLTAGTAAKWWTALQDKVKPKSAKDYLGVVNVFYRWAMAAGHVKQSPTALIIPPHIRPQPRRVFLAPADALRVLDEAEDPDLRFAIYCALHSVYGAGR